MLGRLGLESAGIPQKDRHGLLWLARGRLYVEHGTLRFRTKGNDDLPPGDYAIPFQMLNCILMEPGTTVTHDALRILHRHGTGLVAVGVGGIRFYASMPAGPDRSARARRQATVWADATVQRIEVARRMYAWRLGEVLPHSDLAVLRGIEGARAKASYQRIAESCGVHWKGRRYDREQPEAADVPNQAINHAATAVVAAAETAVAVTGTIPQLGFIHEDSGIAFCLDIADLYRDAVTLPCAFGAARDFLRQKREPLEAGVRRLVGRTIRREKVLSSMLDRILDLFDADDDHRDA
jgi:CRISPR-associated protein Cas1